MRQIGNSNSRQGCAQVYLNSAYDVVAQNGIIMGSVRYAFIDGDGMWCIAILGHNGMPYHGKSYHETESLFDLIEGEPTWTMPVKEPGPSFDEAPKVSPEAWDKIELQPSPGFLLLTKENPS